ncbi:conserved hypothetical protein [Desulfarculus baarsii DSM 2075]|uniref:Lysylphosphatidylglycerol synthetase/UPF0104 n=1 Tax=Desulfarculus baarsii (strain ATCC 33931 / DSM 2075 / LMG 7858 / VKM B-1802 / 2st14) TaxID=644282 RepID=E1QLJ5_DESB2|nr:lysylphosphatidylglycerol synthase domain-containing protein [Desulfarculus baarsii]ADK86430.1 conserved hypothetical protein [Desulfarculus baarsii DSM 2075]
MNLRKLTSLAVALAVTGGLFYFLARTTTWEDWIAIFGGLDARCLFGFLALYLASMALRAARYRLLLRASSAVSPPGMKDLLLVTFASNLFVDLLPARSGSLAYIVFLNRKLKVELSSCVSSFAYSFVFDIFGMLPLFGLAIWLHARQTGDSGLALYGLLAVLAVAGVAALVMLERLLNWGAAVAGRRAARLGGRQRAFLQKAAAEALAMAADVTRVRQSGVFWRLLGVSVAIRLGKYVGLYVLIMGFAGQFGQAVVDALGFPLVLFALLAAEATASLPVSGIAGFGAYEGVMGATLLAAGLAQAQAAMIPFALHLTTQAIDYCLGGLALAWLGLKKRD